MRKVYALLITIAVFIPLTFAVMTLVSIRPWVLDRNFYKRLLDDNRLYEIQLNNGLPNAFTQDLFATEQLPTQALNAALTEIITADYLRAQTLMAIDTAFDFTEGHRSDVEPTFDITPIKRALAGAGGSRFAQSLAASLPFCAGEQTPVASAGHLTRCIDAQGSVGAAAEQIKNALPALIDALPDHVVVGDSVDLWIGRFRYNQLVVGGALYLLDLGVMSITGIALLAGLVGAYLGGTNLRARLKWGSTSLFVPASLILFMGLILTPSPIVTAVADSVTASRYSETYREALIGVLTQVIHRVGTGFLITGWIACLIALGLLVWSFATPAKENTNVKVVQVPVRNS